ncbi:TIGR03435 family protein [Granulicella mallensis]|nr:TIGR03435 family protein [Granulicella mallensis]
MIDVVTQLYNKLSPTTPHRFTMRRAIMMGPVELHRRRIMLLAVAMLATLPRAFGQEQHVAPMAKNAHPSYEVATIKPTDPEDGHAGFHTIGQRLFIENQTMNGLIAFAYAVHPKQIVDAPEWFSKDHFDIKGVPDIEGEPNLQQQREMLQKLLNDRFKLKFHRDKRDLSIFAITVAKGGPKLEASKSAPDSLLDQTRSNNGPQQTWKLTNNSMADFAQLLGYLLDRPVVNETGLKGKFDFDLSWTVDGSLSDDPKAPPGLFTAIQEQLGLKVEGTRGPADVLVMEHVERPSAD